MKRLLLIAALIGLIRPAMAAVPDDLAAHITLPPGWTFAIFADGLGDARLMALTPQGDILLSTYRDGRILRVKAGATTSSGVDVLAEGLSLPHGLALDGDTLHVATESRVIRYHFDGTHLSNPTVVLNNLPSGGGHTSRTIRKGPDGLFYVTAGSSCNVCRESNEYRAAMLRFGESHAPEIFASGLRNTVGFDWQPGTGDLYGVDNGRDLMGDDVPDDEVNLIREGKHYGWPYRHGAGIPDPQFASAMPKGFETVSMVHGLGAHVAPLSLRFLIHQHDPAFQGAALVAEHGSWNRSRKAGYRLIRLTFGTEGKITQSPFMTGCLVKEEVRCRPVDTLEAADGTIYVSDDRNGAIYRIAPPK